jgi:peroxiredoxin
MMKISNIKPAAVFLIIAWANFCLLVNLGLAAEREDTAAKGTQQAVALSDEALKLELPDTAGKKQSLAEQKQPIVVLFFIGLECPVANTYVSEVKELQAKFAKGKQEIQWLGIHSDTGVTAEAAKKHVAEYKLEYPVLLDSDQKLAAACGAKVLGQVVVLHDKKIVYRGRIDDRFATNGKRRDSASTHELADVLSALENSKNVIFSETAAYGCPIPKAKI